MAKKRIIRIFNALVVCLFLTSPVFAQTNLFANPGFEQSNGFQTDYTRVINHSGVVGPGYYAIDYDTDVYGGGVGWPDIQGHGGSGRFMMVNGFGGPNNPNKVVWKQTVTVTPNTDYTFSCFVANLNQYVQGQIYPAKLRLKINGQDHGSLYNLPTDNEWHEWPDLPVWNSGSYPQAIVEIYDNYTGNSGWGDDFAIDDLSFIAQVYTVTLTEGQIDACLSMPVTYNVMDHVTIYPNTQGMTVDIVTPPSHGQATLLSNNNIRYLFNDQSYTGTTDQFRFRVSSHGASAEAWVHVDLSRPPVVEDIAAPPAICAGGGLGIDVPSFTPNGTGQWQYCETSTGFIWQPFDQNNIPLSMNGMWVHYSVINDCGEGVSNAVQITVTNGPSITGQTPQINPICVGDDLSLTAPAYNPNGSQILSQGWVASPTATGEYAPINLNNIPLSYNGWYIRYRIEGSCGYVYSNPARQLIVNVPPDITGTLQAPEAICAGYNLDVTPPTYSGNGTGSWEICQTQNGSFQPFNINNVPATYNNWYLRYKVTNDCGSDPSNAVQIHVNDAPTVATPATPGAICAGDSFTLTPPNIQNHGATITDQGWQIAATQNGNYTAFNNYNVPYTYNNYWIRYFAQNECGITPSTAVQVTVNDEPVVGNITAPAGICAGDSFDLIAPTVQWRHTNQGTGSWEIAPTSSGEFVPLNNANIPYEYNGYYIRYKAVNGCGFSYSTNVVQVTVYSTDPINEGEITACDAIYHHGILCSATGEYVSDTTLPTGCSVQVSWHFTLGEEYIAIPEEIQACDSYYWPRTQRTYETSGVYDTLIVSGNPMVCDSTFTLALTINNAPEILTDIAAPTDVCSGRPIDIMPPPYQMNHVDGGDSHWEYATSASGPFTAFDPSANTLNCGTYYLRYAVINTCDETYSNVVSFHVDDVPVASMELSGMQVCEGQTLDLPEINVNWNNLNVNDRLAQWQMSSTQNGTYATIDTSMTIQMSHNGYWLRFVAHNTCGDDIVGPVPITVLSAEDVWLDTETACDFYELPSGEMITVSQVVDYEVFEPCFHIVHQPVEINYSVYVVEPITSCREEYVWHGRTFYQSDQMQYAWDTLTNVDHCDSIVELNLSFGNYAIYTYNRTGCDSYVWEMNPTVTYTESVRDSVFVPATGPDDCDTWHILDLTLGHKTTIDGGDMVECSGFVWHGVPYYEDAIIYDSLQTDITHCDSIIVYQLNIIPSVETDTSIVSCQSMWWYEHFCENEGDYQHVFESAQGCDSIVTMHFSKADEIVYHIDTTACEFFNWYGYYFSETGQFSHTFHTPTGCDSTVVMHATIVDTEVFTRFLTVCDSIDLDGVWYTEPGNYYVYSDTIPTQSGCDSIIYRINLTVNKSDQMGLVNGPSNVYVASNLVSGIYRYEINPEEVDGSITWSLSNSDWLIVDALNNYCMVYVTTPGSATLSAHFTMPECGEVERYFEINAGFFGIGDHDVVAVNVYPNPTNGTLTVEAEGIESIRLTNMMGQVLDWREYDRSDAVTLNLKDFTPSVYLLEIKTVDGMVKKRVMVSR